MKKKMSTFELQVFIKRYLENGNYITVMSSPSAFISINVRVRTGRRIAEGMQFHAGDGYINVQFKDIYNLDNDPIEVTFEYENDKPKGYYVTLSGFTLFFPEAGVMDLLNNLSVEVEKQRKEDLENDIIREEADRFIDKDTWASIDNMMEK